MKTVSQLAQELNVNRTTLHRLIQRNNIETLQEGNKRLIDAQAEQAILKAFNSKSLQGETLQNNNKLLQQRNVAQAEQLANKDKTIDSLQTQLAEKDKQINLLQSQITELKADKDKLNARLDKAEEERERLETNISNLTTALTAAQALHGMDKQQAVIEVKADEAPEEDQTPEQPPQQKLSFFQRLFRKRSE